MKNQKIKVSVIIPVRTITPYLRETVKHLKLQSYKNFEIIVLPDEKEKLAGVRIIPSQDPTPAYKRNLGAQKARGKILAFLDDDSYPDKNWLKNAIALFSHSAIQPFSHSISAVCGPTLTPPADSIYQRASGWVWASWLGSGGAGVYRNRKEKRREVDDYPSVNLSVRKADFDRAGGFDINHWPGEDTKLCLDLVYKLKKKIIYDPKVLVYHHRRPVLLPHLKQISRYALRRGFFAKRFSKTSLKIGYLIPSLFICGLVFGAFFSIFSPLIRLIYLSVIAFYLLLLLVSGLEVFLKERNLHLAFLVMFAIFATHLWYGLLFPLGYFKKDLGVIPHQVDKRKKVYVGG